VSGECDDSSGTFEIAGLRDGEWTLSATAPGFVPASLPPVSIPGDSSSLMIVMRRAATLSGIVVDESGNPVPNVFVYAPPPWEELRAGNKNRNLFAATTRTDPQGGFTLQDVEPGPVRLRADSYQWVTVDPIPLEAKAGQTMAGLRVTVVPIDSRERKN